MSRDTSSWFCPFFNVDAQGNEFPEPYGIIERGMPEGIVQSIRDLRGALVSSRDLWNCFVVAPAWLGFLRQAHPDAFIEDDGDPGSDGATSGYYVDGRGIRPHLWVIVGPQRLIFDPTACQFDQGSSVRLDYPKPGIYRSRYRSKHDDTPSSLDAL